MNPKIVDFGMARIFRGDEMKQIHIVSLEQMIICRLSIQWKDFSVKSDVYSFDVLLLEIIADSKNSGYYNERYPDINLVGHVRNWWREGDALEIIDSSLGESYPVNKL